MATGTVKMFNEAKGYGFIAPEGGGHDVFLHHTDIQISGVKTLAEGQRVSYEMGTDPKSKAPTAKNVTPI
ncbi:cold-shock protein [Pseudomonas sp. MAFF 212408]|uniref:Cold-shock protein n=1 Tax=Pseudomonas kitaguniensis TaxID=2607908 RepID=A0A5N7KTL4_9PSED|nr:cold-shock protein [Pseudomonas kitaguniensis]MPR05022.1 cold-shock protein [Pseudomonas kitaguniensis]